jgi:citrate lyase gamma subunit
MSGQSQTLPGVITTTFEESGGQITIKPYANTPIQNTELGLIAGIASSGDLMVVVEPSNQIDQYTIEDGLLFIVDSPTTDSQAYGLTSVSLFPNTR